MKKGFVFYIHSVAGLLSGLFILLMSVSGAVLVFHDELDALQYPPIIPGADKKILPVDSFYNNLQLQFPHAEISSCDIAKNSTRPFIFSIYDSSYKDGTEQLQVYMHPQMGLVLNTRSGKHNIISWIGTLHNSFHLGKKGEWLLGFFGFVFLLSITTGLILYRKRILAVLSFKKEVFKRRRLHQLIGVYALLFNLMIGITGVWMQRYVFKKDFYTAGNYIPVLKPSPALFFSIDSSLKKIQEQFPHFTSYVIYFAQSKKGKTAVYGSQSTNSFIHSKKFADAIFLDSTGKMARTAFVNEIDASDRYDIINSQIHFGQYGGLPIKIIYCVLGLASGLLSITGFWLWFKRRRVKTKPPYYI